MCYRILAPILILITSNLAAVAKDAPVTQDDAGLLHGDYRKVSKPITEHDLPPLGSVRQILLTPDGKKLVVHEWGSGEELTDRLLVLDVSTAKIEKVLIEEKGGLQERPRMKLSGDGKSVLVAGPGGLVAYDLTSGKAIKEYPVVQNKTVLWYSYTDDRTKAAGSTREPGAMLWNFAADKAHFIAYDFVSKNGAAYTFPLAGRDVLLVAVRNPEEKGNQIVLFDPDAKKSTRLTEFDGAFDVLPAPDGKRAYVFRQEDPQNLVWTTVEEWDLIAAKLVKKQAMKPNLSSIGLKLAQDGNTLFLHEYMVQPVIVWNLKAARFMAVVAPEGGGCRAFAITPDGKRLVAFVGPWIQGTLVPQKLAVYDTSEFILHGQ